MYIFLPDAKDGLCSLVEKAGSNGFLDRHVPYKRVHLGEFKIPKFKFEYEIEVSQVLQSLGLVLPFDPDGFGLREMVYDHPLCVSSMFHKSLIEVDDKVTELMLLQVVDDAEERKAVWSIISNIIASDLRCASSSILQQQNVSVLVRQSDFHERESLAKG
ncbi:hypothetical protein ACET3Z_013898 [Daucus carota]